MQKENSLDLIKNDPSRDDKAKKDGIKFLKGDLVNIVSTDKGFQDNVKQAIEKLKKMVEQLQRQEDKKKKEVEDLSGRELELAQTMTVSLTEKYID